MNVSQQPLMAFDKPMRQMRLFACLAVVLFAIETIVNGAHAFFVIRIFDSAMDHDMDGFNSSLAAWRFLVRHERYDYVLMLIAIAAFFTSLYQARQCMTKGGRHDWKLSYMWTIGGLLIPGVNFVLPWLGVAEIDRATTSAARSGQVHDQWRLQSARATWIVALILGGCVIAVRLTTEAIDEPVSPSTVAEALAYKMHLELLTVCRALVFAVSTVTIAWFLGRQHRNLRKVALCLATA